MNVPGVLDISPHVPCSLRASIQNPFLSPELTPDLSPSRSGDPADVPAAVPGAGTSCCLNTGAGPCLPPGRPAGSCQCCPRLWLFKAPLLPPPPWDTDPEWQVRIEGWRCGHSGTAFLGCSGWAHRPGEMPLCPLQASSDGALCPHLRAQLCRMWRGQRKGQSHHGSQLLREEHISQAGEERPCSLPGLPVSSPQPASQVLRLLSSHLHSLPGKDHAVLDFPRPAFLPAPPYYSKSCLSPLLCPVY